MVRIAVERLALNALHGNVVDALGLTDVVDGEDVGMIQRRGRTHFALETLQRRSVLL